MDYVYLFVLHGFIEFSLVLHVWPPVLFVDIWNNFVLSNYQTDPQFH